MLNEEENQAIKVLLDMNCNKIAGEEFTVNEKAYIGIAIGLINKLQKENEEKDKMINLMAKYIAKEDKTEIFCNYKTVCDQNCEECVEAYFKESE